jgi:hypothetical protein
VLAANGKATADEAGRAIAGNGSAIVTGNNTAHGGGF